MSKHIKESKKQKVISEFIKADKNNIDALMKVLSKPVKPPICYTSFQLVGA